MAGADGSSRWQQKIMAVAGGRQAKWRNDVMRRDGGGGRDPKISDKYYRRISASLNHYLQYIRDDIDYFIF